MSGIVSGVGLVSGLPIQDIIDQLIAVESRPYLQTLQRIEQIQQKRVSYATLNARLLSLKNAINQFDRLSFFRRSKATSSNSDVLTAFAAEGAVQGSFAFRVQSLVTSHQLISAGFADADQTTVGNGTLSFEIGQGKLAPASFLEDLRGGLGVGRGVIEIQDRSGNSAQIDLTATLTVDDVISAINSDPRINVQATVSGDSIILTDLTGSSTSNLIVSDVGGGTMALDLGLRQSVAGAVLTGTDINDVSLETQLLLLNDGNGVRLGNAGGDLVFGDGAQVLFEVSLNARLSLSTHLQRLNGGNGVTLGELAIGTASGDEFTVDLAAEYDFGDGLGLRGVRTVGDVIFAINSGATAAGVDVVAQLEPGTLDLQLVDNTTGNQPFAIEDLSGASANDLGLTVAAEEGTITARGILQMSTLGDVVRAINFAEGNIDLLTGDREIAAAVGDNGLQVTRAGGSTFTIEAGGDSSAADDLGLLASVPTSILQTRSLIAGLDTVLLRSLNGGGGVSTSDDLVITNSAGAQINVDLSQARNVQDVIEAINAQAGIRAELNSDGNGIILIDEAAGGGGLSVADNQTARDLGFGGGASSSSGLLNSGNLQLQYISEATLLDALKQGSGVGTGRFEILTSEGSSFTVSISDNQRTVGDLISQINNSGEQFGISARINDTGDGVLIVDSNGGAASFTIRDQEGTVAAGLNFVADAQVAGLEQSIDGSFEFHIEIASDDTLNDVVNKINEARLGISATVISDGSSTNPFRLSITSGVTGTAGELTLDTGATGLSMSDLVKPQDAVLFFGGEGSNNPIVIRSSSNTLTDVVQDVTITLLSTSQEEVGLVVGRDVDSIVETINTFVTTYNNVIEDLDDLTFFEPETLQSGLLRGEATVSTIRTRLRSVINAQIPTAVGEPGRLSAVGIRFGNGGKLEFDEAKFREAFGEDPQAVEALFTLSDTEVELDGSGNVVIDPATGEPSEKFRGLGFGFQIEAMLDQLTRTFDGVLASKDGTLGRQEDLLDDRAGFLLSLLDGKRARLESRFLGLERALSALTSQQSALGLLSSLG